MRWNQYSMVRDMNARSNKDGETWKDTPVKFEAGTPNIEGVIGTGAAPTSSSIGLDNIHEYEKRIACICN